MTLTTQAAILVETGKPLELWTLTMPAPAPGQVLVELAFSGVCHSQLNEVKGLRGADRFVPHCLGHEGSGTVLEVGPGVTKVKPGQAVVLTWLKGEGGGPPGAVYGSEQGRVNAGAVTTFQQHALVAESRVVPVPEGLPLDVAALLGCALPTGAGIVLNTLKPVPGQSVVVFGAGGIGLSAIMAASALGAGKVIAVDRLASKLQVALELGATDVIDASSVESVAAVRALSGGKGTDFAIEATGSTGAMEQALAATRDGGLCVIAGNSPAGQKMAVDPYDLIRGKRLLGSWGGECQPDRDIPRLAALILEGRIPAQKLLSHRYSLTEVNSALSALEAGQITRAMLSLTAAG